MPDPKFSEKRPKTDAPKQSYNNKTFATNRKSESPLQIPVVEDLEQDDGILLELEAGRSDSEV